MANTHVSLLQRKSECHFLTISILSVTKIYCRQRETSLGRQMVENSISSCLQLFVRWPDFRACIWLFFFFPQLPCRVFVELSKSVVVLSFRMQRSVAVENKFNSWNSCFHGQNLSLPLTRLPCDSTASLQRQRSRSHCRPFVHALFVNNQRNGFQLLSDKRQLFLYCHFDAFTSTGLPKRYLRTRLYAVP